MGQMMIEWESVATGERLMMIPKVKLERLRAAIELAIDELMRPDHSAGSVEVAHELQAALAALDGAGGAGTEKAG